MIGKSKITISKIEKWYEGSRRPAYLRRKMNATTLSLNASHSSYVSYPNEIVDFILNATKGK
jgi:hypothetical protein